MYSPAAIARAEAALLRALPADQFSHGLPRTPAPEAIDRARYLQSLKQPDGSLARPLTRDDHTFIVVEQLLAKIDFRYCGERYFKINKEGQELAPLFPLWESQELILAALARVEEEHFQEGHPDGVLCNVLKGRQLGCSTLAQSLIAHRAVTHTHVKALIGSDTPDNSGSDGLFGMFELLISNLPWYLHPGETGHVKNKHIVFANGSIVRTESGKSMKGGLTEEGGSKGQMGRSKTYSALHLSELSTWEHPDQIDDSLMPAVPRTPRTLAIFESTAKGRLNWWHRHWLSAARGKGRFTPIFVPWYAEKSKYWLPAPSIWVPAPDTLAHARAAEIEGPKYMRTRVQLTREQLFWYESTKADFAEKGAVYKFMEEYPATPEESFQYSGHSIFPIGVRERIRTGARPMITALEVRSASELAQLQQQAREGR